MNLKPSILTIANLKGGTGKTTSAIYIATALAHQDASVIVIDTDSEQSAMNWAIDSDLPFEVVPMLDRELGRQAKRYRSEGRIVIVDCAPNNRDTVYSAALAADLILVPVAPTGQDVNRLEATLRLLVEVEESRDKDLTHILVTRWDRRRILAREFMEVFDKYPVLAHKISDRVIYQKEFGAEPTHLIEYLEVVKEVFENVS